MRLSCPNCDAQYELSDDAIPAGGRDVQCSNCGHAWFQMPPAHEAEAESEEALFDPPEDAAEDEPSAEDHPAEEPHPQDDDTDGSDDEAEKFEGPAPLQRRSIDESLLSVLREEAEREAKARQAEPPRGIETQTDMGLEAAVAATVSPAARRVAELKGLDLSEDDGDATPARSGTRRDMLPDIEEINSTLRASDDRYDADAEVAALPSLHKRGRSSFRSGFVLMIIIATLMVLAYVMAPKIVQQIPASAGAMAAYVDMVNNARVALDGLMQSAIGVLRGISGSEG